MTMTVGSLFSGVGGFDLGFHRAGFDVRWMCEIDRDCRDVLCRNFPDVDVIYTDVRTIPVHQVERVDVLIGGFPCQDVSVAGRRAGLDGERSGLFFDFCRIIGELRPTFVVMENVAGLLSSNGGRDMAVILGTLRDLGAHDIGWRVLDSQWFNVAQGRSRVFLVGDFRERRAAEILALSDGLRWGAPPRRKGGGTAAAYAVRCAQTSSNGWGVSEEVAYTLDGSQGQAVAFDWQSGGDVRPNVRENCSPSLQANQVPAVYAMTAGAGIRRFTPREEERLMGWPDDWTRWGASGKEMSDSTRYRMAGNGVTSNVAEWIARRILVTCERGEGEMQEGRDAALLPLPFAHAHAVDAQTGSEGGL